MTIEDKLAAIKTDIVGKEGMQDANDIAIEIVDMPTGIAYPGHGGASIVFDRAHAEAADDKTLRFLVEHELMHALAMRKGSVSGAPEVILVADDAGPYNADILGDR